MKEPARKKRPIGIGKKITELVIVIVLVIAVSGTWATPPTGSGATDQLAVDLNNEDVKSEDIVVNSDASATSNTAILKNMFLNAVSPVFLPEGEISFNDTLVLGVGVKVYASPKTILKLLTNVNGIVVNDKTVLEDVTLSVPAGYTQTAVYLDGSKHINTCTARNLRIEGTSGYTGIGIQARAMGDTDYVCFANFEDIYMKNLGTGILLQDNQKVPPVYPCGWVNGNRFTNTTFYVNTGISLKGNPSGNEFNFQYQTVPSSVTAIYCEGSQNYFSGFIWDTGGYGSTGINATFTKKSLENVVALPPIDIQDQFIIDEGTDNCFPYDNQNGSQLVPLNSRANLTVLSDEYRKNKPNFFGAQDDCLAYIDKRGATVTVSGNIAVNPGVSTLFNARYSGTEYCFNNLEGTPAVIEIDTSSRYIDNMYMIGMSFIDGLIPEDYTVELITTPGGSYYPWVKVTGNKSASILHEFDPNGVKVYKIRITLTKAVYNSKLNPKRQIKLSQIYGANAGIYASSPFLFRDGDTMYGDLEFNSAASGVILRSPNGSKYKLTVSNSGVLSATPVQ